MHPSNRNALTPRIPANTRYNPPRGPPSNNPSALSTTPDQLTVARAVRPVPAIRSSTQVAGQGIEALDELQKIMEAGFAELERELKKKRILGLSIGRDPKTAKELEILQSAISWFMIRISSEELFKQINASRILNAYRPVAGKLAVLALTLANAGGEMEGYAKFKKEDRKEIGEGIHKLRTSFMGLINLLLGQPLRERRMSNNHQEAQTLFDRGQHTLTLLKRAETAWMNSNK